MMRIAAPLAPDHDVHQLVDAGADEFYCGLVRPEEDLDLLRMNRRSWSAANFDSAEELEEVTRQVHERGKEILLALNSQHVEPVARDRFARSLRTARGIGMDGVIVGSLSVMLLAQDVFAESNGVSLVASTCLGITNDSAVKFFESMGIRRIILPRNLTSGEVRNLAELNPDMSFEFFVLNERCAFYESYCGMMHEGTGGPKIGSGCCGVSDPRISGRFRENACGACELFNLDGLKTPITVKIVGRGRPAERILRDVSFVKLAIEAIDDADDQPSYHKAVRELYLEVYGRDCSLDCHYPRVTSAI